LNDREPDATYLADKFDSQFQKELQTAMFWDRYVGKQLMPHAEACRSARNHLLLFLLSLFGLLADTLDSSSDAGDRDGLSMLVSGRQVVNGIHQVRILL